MRAPVKGKRRAASRAAKKRIPETPGKTPLSQTGPAAARDRNRRLHWSFAVGLFIWGLLIYWPCLSGPFILDDYDLMEVFSAVRTGDLKATIRSGRPLLFLTYIANYQWNGFEPFSFHLTNVLLHALNALLLWRFLAALLTPDRIERTVSPKLRQVLIYGIPLLFLTSPIQTESVAYISSRSEVLAATFYLAALWVFASPLRENRPWITAFLVALLFVGAASSKQDKLTLPFTILLLD